MFYLLLYLLFLLKQAFEFDNIRNENEAWTVHCACWM